MDILSSISFSSLPALPVPPESLALFAVTGFFSILRLQQSRAKEARKVFPMKNKKDPLSVPVDFDVAMVGAGPAGSTAAYYSLMNNKNGLRVGLFDKKKFPRSKPCGDAWCAPALSILEEMGILGKMEKDGITHAVTRGGLISPFGYQCINTDGASYGSVTGCKTYAIKREIADEYLVRAADKIGAELFEGVEILSVEFSGNETDGTGYWTLSTKNEAGEIKAYTTRMLLICDGSTSYLAQKLGIIPNGTQPQSICSTGYIANNTWKDADGVMIFTKSVLPGYSALFRHYNGDMYVGTYVLPGGKATSGIIAPFENELMEQHPYVREALGDNYKWSKRRTVAPIRMGGIEKSYSKQCLVVGDAAGHVDPLTGEGIHTAMIAGKIAGQVIQEMYANKNFTPAACAAYHHRCHDAFGYEFLYSSIAAKVIYHMPIAIDAVACVGQRRGQPFLDFFGEVMTGVKPKSAFLQPDLLVELMFEMIKQVIVQYVFQTPPLVPYHLGQQIVDDKASKKQGTYA